MSKRPNLTDEEIQSHNTIIMERDTNIQLLSKEYYEPYYLNTTLEEYIDK